MDTSNQIVRYGKTAQAILRSTEYNRRIWQPDIYTDLLTNTYNELHVALEGNIDNEISSTVREGGLL